jgi:hypothetical protein
MFVMSVYYLYGRFNVDWTSSKSRLVPSKVTCFWIYTPCVANFAWRKNCPHAWLSITPCRLSGSGYWTCTRNVDTGWRCVIIPPPPKSRPFTEEPPSHFSCAVGTRRTPGGRAWKQSWQPCLSPHLIILWSLEYLSWFIIVPGPKKIISHAVVYQDYIHKAPVFLRDNHQHESQC